MKIAFVSALLVQLFILSIKSSVAGESHVTHEGQVEVELTLRDPGTAGERLDKVKGDLILDWGTRKGDFNLVGAYYHWMLDLSSDLVRRPDAKVLVKGAPRVLLGPKTTEALFALLAKGSGPLKQKIDRIINDSKPQFSNGVFLPFYSCGSCEANSPLYNVFDHSLTEEIVVKHALLQKKELVLKVRLYRVKPIPGAFNTIGSENARSFINN